MRQEHAVPVEGVAGGGPGERQDLAGEGLEGAVPDREREERRVRQSGAGPVNQLAYYDSIGLFDGGLPKPPSELPKLADYRDASAPLDARAKRDGFNVVYHLDDLKLPAIYSSLFTNDRLIKERPAIAQKFVAALAEAVHFVENNPEKAKQSVSRVLALQDFDSAQSAYEAYAKRLINRRLTIPAARVKAAIDAARQAGANVRRKSAETFDNSFAEHLEKSGFIKDLWGAELPAKKW